jgi:hypothetical protein
LQSRCGKACKLDIVVCCIEFGDNLAKEQDKKCENNSLNQEIGYRTIKLKYLIHSEVQDYHYHDINQVVTYQDCCQQPFRLVEKALNAVSLAVVFYALDVLAREREISYLRARVESREQ